MVFSLLKMALGHSVCFVFSVCVGRFSDSILLIRVNGTQVRETRWQKERVVLGSPSLRGYTVYPARHPDATACAA